MFKQVKSLLKLIGFASNSQGAVFSFFSKLILIHTYVYSRINQSIVTFLQNQFCTQLTKAYMTETSSNHLLLIDKFCYDFVHIHCMYSIYIRTHQDQFACFLFIFCILLIVCLCCHCHIALIAFCSTYFLTEISAFALVADKTSIKMVSLDIEALLPIQISISGSYQFDAVDYDLVEDMIYWVDSSNSAIMRVSRKVNTHVHKMEEMRRELHTA